MIVVPSFDLRPRASMGNPSSADANENDDRQDTPDVETGHSVLEGVTLPVMNPQVEPASPQANEGQSFESTLPVRSGNGSTRTYTVIDLMQRQNRGKIIINGRDYTPKDTDFPGILKVDGYTLIFSRNFRIDRNRSPNERQASYGEPYTYGTTIRNPQGHETFAAKGTGYNAGSIGACV
jgi:hypothetical protein